MVKFLFWVSTLFCFLAGCSQPPSPATVPGTYMGEYGGGTETIVIRPDETYTQAFVKAGTQVYTNDGTWGIDNDRIEFYSFMSMSDFIMFKKPPKYVGVRRSHWKSITSTIIFNGDIEYWVNKKK